MSDRQGAGGPEHLSEPRFRALIENISDAIALLHPDGTIIYSGPSTARILGYEVGENVGRSAFDLVHPDDRDTARQRFGQLLTAPVVTVPLAYRLLHRDGTWRNMEGIAQNLVHEPGIQALVITYRDVTERMRWEQTLRESEERYRSVIAALDEGIIVLDADGTITAMNESAGRILKTAPEQQIGRSTMEMRGMTIYEDGTPFPPEEYPGIVALETGVPQRGVVTGVEKPDGTRTWISINALPLYPAGSDVPSGAVVSFTDVTERKQFEERLMHAAHHDALTHLPNRTLFMERLGQLVARARRRTQYRFALFFLDFDRFKSVNDTHGHAAGDLLLVEIAERLRHSLRQHDIIARLAGDEFAVVVEEIDGPEAALEIAARLHEALAAPFALKRTSVSITASIGIALGTTGYRSPEELLRDADAAMYRAKAGGRGRSAVADAAMRARHGNRSRTEANLRAALARDELDVAFAPIVRLETGEIAGYEIHLDGTPRLQASDVNDAGLQTEIDRRLIREACRHVRAWQQGGGPSAARTITVPIHGSNLVHTDFAGEVADALREAAVAPNRLIIQITESVLTERGEAAAATLAALAALGIGIHLNGFGVGQSSLLFIRRFPVAAVKLDRTFIEMLERESDHAVVRAVIALAHTLGLRVIAGGAGTERYHAALHAAGCDLLVGTPATAPR